MAGSEPVPHRAGRPLTESDTDMNHIMVTPGVQPAAVETWIVPGSWGRYGDYRALVPLALAAKREWIRLLLVVMCQAQREQRIQLLRLTLETLDVPGVQIADAPGCTGHRLLAWRPDDGEETDGEPSITLDQGLKSAGRASLVVLPGGAPLDPSLRALEVRAAAHWPGEVDCAFGSSAPLPGRREVAISTTHPFANLRLDDDVNPRWNRLHAPERWRPQRDNWQLPTRDDAPARERTSLGAALFALVNREPRSYKETTVQAAVRIDRTLRGVAA
jgi:hypothetical protein